MLIAYIVVVCVSLFATGIFGTLFILEALDKIEFKDVTFFWVTGIAHVAVISSIVFLGNLCAYIANMN